jgi:sulfoxide reductase catalytic subunit YedY
MLIRSSNSGLRYSDVTPQDVYLNRRRFLGTGAAALAGLALGDPAEAAPLTNFSTGGPLHNLRSDTPCPQKNVTSHNNFYEFGTGKKEPVKNAPKWKPDPAWPVRIEGEVKAAKTLDLAAISKLGLEERIYRMRCVEGWSVVVPWIGVPLASVLKQVEPTGKAKFVAFESFYDASQMLSKRQAGIDFPYIEGLRLDEAMHPLTMLAVGLYGKTLPNQNGAPIRLVVPWKYGFKGIKSIVRIRLQEQMPPTAWNKSWAAAYGFYSNVNPNRDHPGWSQKEEDRLDGSGFLGQGRRIKTEMFNGYGAQVAGLYSGMDLIRNY